MFTPTIDKTGDQSQYCRDKRRRSRDVRRGAHFRQNQQEKDLGNAARDRPDRPSVVRATRSSTGCLQAVLCTCVHKSFDPLSEASERDVRPLSDDLSSIGCRAYGYDVHVQVSEPEEQERADRFGAPERSCQAGMVC